MAKKKKSDLEVYEGDICGDPEETIVDSLLEDIPPSLDPIVGINRDFMSEIAFKEEEKAKKETVDKIITPADIQIPSQTPSQVLTNNMKGSVKITVKPGTSLSNSIANPTENDNLVSVIRDNKPTNTVLRAIMGEIAEEAAYIKAWRNDNWNTGEDISEATFKRIRMLKHLVETIVEQEKIKKNSVTGKVDFHGEAFQKVLKYFLETIQKIFRKVHIPVQFEDIFFTELAKSFDNFEKIAERIYYGKD